MDTVRLGELVAAGLGDRLGRALRKPCSRNDHVHIRGGPVLAHDPQCGQVFGNTSLAFSPATAPEAGCCHRGRAVDWQVDEPHPSGWPGQSRFEDMREVYAAGQAVDVVVGGERFTVLVVKP